MSPLEGQEASRVMAPGGGVDKWPAGAIVQNLAQAGHLSTVVGTDFWAERCALRADGGGDLADRM